jgi:tetratricopeptide (TPR) repeat protein
MYLYPRRRRRSNPWRVFLLLVLIAVGAYGYTIVQRQEFESPFIPTPTPTREPASYQLEAEDLYLQGDLDAARAAYEEAIRLDPDDAASYVPLVRLLTLEGQYREAIERAQQAVALAGEYAPAWAVLCMAYDWDGQVPAAIDACLRAVQLDPTYAPGYAYLAEAYADASRWNEALEAAQTAIGLDPGSVDAHRNYGYVLESMGNWSGAVEAYQRALEIHPNLAYIYVALGRNYQALADTANAIGALRRATELDPDWAEALDQLGWTYRAIEDYEQARYYLELAIEADPEYAPAYGHLAYTFWARRNYEDAIPNYRRAIDLAYRASRRDARGFTITLEPIDDDDPYPSPDVVLSGTLRETGSQATRLTAALEPEPSGGEWARTSGRVSLSIVSGNCTLSLEGMPQPPDDQVYVGWFEGLYALDGLPFSTGPLDPSADGTLDIELVVEPILGPRIEYLYTLGLCYFYRAQCELAYPVFEAALQMDPDEVNALEGIRLCREAEGTAAPTASP